MIRATAWIVGFLVAAIAVVLWGLGSPEASSVIIVLIGAILMAVIGRAMTVPEDASWLPAVVVFGYLVKIVASMTRYEGLEILYSGVGDASGYHRRGSVLVHTWRAFEVPSMTIGTRVVDGITGLLYFPHVPTKLGGFFIFATIAFLGQIMLYGAFRRSVVPRRLGWYAFAVFFLPTIVFWPSSIGKESLMLLFIGMAAYGASGLLYDYRLRWGAVFAIGIAGCAVIRPHVALMLAIAVTVTLLVSRRRSGDRAAWRKALAVAAIGAVLVTAGLVTSTEFGLDFTAGVEALEEAEDILARLEDSTTRGGSGVEGGGISNAFEFPAGFVKVMFRPLLFEAHNVQALASSLEGTLLLALFLWRILPMVRNGWHIRSDPFLLFAALFTLGFAIAFSSVNNLGLMARQRSQVMPFFIALVVGLGWAVTGAAGVGEAESGISARNETPAALD